ncbi:hypothetical protein DFP73DRAFT_634644 [Morchella snyderi]|nr:hypothetical protein DFP73DRAFT_634644 [Morchella snyderi]
MSSHEIPTHYNACLASGAACNMAFSMMPNSARARNVPPSVKDTLGEAAHEVLQAQKAAAQQMKDQALKLKQPSAHKDEIRKAGDALFEKLDQASHNGIMKIKAKYDEMVDSDQFEGSALDELLTVAKFLATTIAEAWAKFKKMLMEAWEALIRFLGDVWERVKDAWASIENAFEKAQEWFNEAWEKIEQFFT